MYKFNFIYEKNKIKNKIILRIKNNFIELANLLNGA